MAPTAWWNPDIVALLFTYLDLPTQVRFASVSRTWVPEEAVAAVIAAATKLTSHLTCPLCFVAPNALPTTSPSLVFLRAAKTIWRLVALPLLRLSGQIMECPGLLGEVISEVYLLGFRGRRRVLSEQWWRDLLGRWEAAVSPQLLRRILRERGLNENFLEAIKDVNDVNLRNYYIDKAMAVLSEGKCNLHWFPVRFNNELDELTEASFVVEFEIHGVYGVLWFRELYEDDV